MSYYKEELQSISMRKILCFSEEYFKLYKRHSNGEINEQSYACEVEKLFAMIICEAHNGAGLPVPNLYE